MEPLYIKQYEDTDGSTVQMRWGYCREQNAVRLGYSANILVALVGLILMSKGALIGIWVCALVGASFGVAYATEQMASPVIRFTWGPKVLLALPLPFLAVLFTMAAYLLPLIAFWG